MESRFFECLELTVTHEAVKEAVANFSNNNNATIFYDCIEVSDKEQTRTLGCSSHKKQSQIVNSSTCLGPGTSPNVSCNNSKQFMSRSQYDNLSTNCFQGQLKFSLVGDRNNCQISDSKFLQYSLRPKPNTEQIRIKTESKSLSQILSEQTLLCENVSVHSRRNDLNNSNEMTMGTASGGYAPRQNVPKDLENIVAQRKRMRFQLEAMLTWAVIQFVALVALFLFATTCRCSFQALFPCFGGNKCSKASSEEVETSGSSWW
ncbi:uncharacterized protein LOC101846920 [Aplysia californica]|uniref:Uncharacterized protein LOC101846920 n=1 Tax=Aplysia californica TaxID=6500 RepID=A0ABM0K4Q8_APLCA|nr:uncharacterized protein LOC101846920 [Aplysia californica]